MPTTHSPRSVSQLTGLTRISQTQLDFQALEELPAEQANQAQRAWLIQYCQGSRNDRDYYIDRHQWVVGDAAREWCSRELGTVKDFADAVGVTHQQARNCKSVAETYPDLENRVHDVRWALYQSAAGLDDPHPVLAQAEAEGWTRQQLRDYVATLRTEPLAVGEIVERGEAHDENHDVSPLTAETPDTSNDAGGPGGVGWQLRAFVHGKTYQNLRTQHVGGSQQVADAIRERGIDLTADELESLATFIYGISKRMLKEADGGKDEEMLRKVA